MRILLFILLASCSHSVHLVNVSDYEINKNLDQGKKIEVETKQFVILRFVYDTKYVDQAKEDLIAKCPQGEIKDIVTRYSTSHGFLSWHNKIFMQARCFE